MSAEPAEANHDDGLDIDFGIGVAYPSEHSNKDPDVMGEDSLHAPIPQKALSEIGYESEADVDSNTHLDVDNISNTKATYFSGTVDDKDDGDGDGADATTMTEAPIIPVKADVDQDEINWDDPEDEGSEVQESDPGHNNSADDPQHIAAPVSGIHKAQASINTNLANQEWNLKEADMNHDHPDFQTDTRENSTAPTVTQELDSHADSTDCQNLDALTYEDEDNYSREGDQDSENVEGLIRDDAADETMVVHEGVGENVVDIEDHSEQLAPEVEVLFAGNHYSLFQDFADPDRPYILEDTLFQARVSELLDALHNALAEELNDGDELVVRVEDLCLEISPVMASSLQSMTISDFVHLHAKLMYNEHSVEDSSPLRLTILARPSFAYRYQELLAGVRQGLGLSQLCRPFDTGDGVVYASLVKDEDDDEMVHTSNDADGGYDQSADETEDQDDSDYASANDKGDGDSENKEVGAEVTNHVSVDDEDGEDADSSTYDHGIQYDEGELGGSYEPEHEAEDDEYDEDMEHVEAGRYCATDATEAEPTVDQVDLESVGPRAGAEEYITATEPDWDDQQEASTHQEISNPEVAQTVLKAITDDGQDGEDVLALDVDFGAAPVDDEINWEVDGDYIDHAPATTNTVSTTATNGKRQLPDEGVEHEQNDAKRRRSS